MPHIQPRADGLGDRAGRERADQRERLHEAAEHGEDLPSSLVRDDLLDQGHVADEADPVPDAEDDGADTPDREVGADGADRHARGGDEERGAVAAVHGQPLDEPERDDVPEQDAGGREGDEHAEADVAGAVRVGREHDLGHVDAGVRERRPAPDQEDRRQVLVVADESEAGSNLAPVRAADPGDEARLEPAADPDEQERRDEEADRVHRVDRARARARRSRRRQ